MSQKIVLFLSDFKANAEESTYICPDGSPVDGAQTNEAPVKYLLGANPGVSEVLCIVTPAARGTVASLEQAVKAAAPKVRVTEVPFEDGEDFSAGPLARIMASVKKGDEILLETTGGLRDAVMQLLLVSRALSFSGVPTAGAVYANFGAKRIMDCSHLIGLFDLVGGMQELAGFGSVRTLRAYYKEQALVEPAIDGLLSAMEGLNEDITLCRTGRIDQRIEAFNAAMEQAEHCSDPLLRALLPAFRAKFGKKLSVPGLIKWCVNSDMLQQALTIYKERIPGYILGTRTDLVSPIPWENLNGISQAIMGNALQKKKDYESVEEVQFRFLTNMARERKGQYYDFEQNKWPENLVVLTLKHLEELVPHSYYFACHCPVSQLKDIIMDYSYIRALRNMTNHANAESTEEELVNYLAGYGYKRPEETGTADVKAALERGLENLVPRP